MTSQILFLHALTPLHAGTGQGVGVIDLPIAREKATGRPYVPGSSLKGPLRDASRASDAIKNGVFGDGDATGAAQFADARLLLLPVRSLRGTFAYATSSRILHDFASRDMMMAGETPLEVPEPEENGCLVAARRAITINMKPEGAPNANPSAHVVLEDLDVPAQTNEAVAKWGTYLGNKLYAGDSAATDRLATRLCILHEDIFNFLMLTSTEVTARIALDDNTKTVKRGQLWYEETLPPESVLVSVLTAVPLQRHRENGLTTNDVFREAVPVDVAQFGGKATVGRGLCRLVRSNGEAVDAGEAN